MKSKVLLTRTTFDNILVGGDFNVDFQRSSVASNYLLSFIMTLIYVQLISNLSLFNSHMRGMVVRSGRGLITY